MSDCADHDPRPVAVVTGATAGLGVVIATRLCREGYRVVIVGRDPRTLAATREQLVAELPASGSAEDAARSVIAVACDVSDRPQVQQLADEVQRQCGRLDVLVNVVGQSDRGMVAQLEVGKLQELLVANVVTALLCSQACLPLLEARGGVIVNIGSLAAKVGARYLGAYPAAKHALAGLTQQMRLEWKPRGVHVGLISPGPIQRSDAGQRYRQQVQQSAGELPAEAARPGGGTRVKGIAPQRVAAAVMRIIRQRSPDIILPWHLRPLVAIGHVWPRLGDWLLLRFTSSRSGSGD